MTTIYIDTREKNDRALSALEKWLERRDPGIKVERRGLGLSGGDYSVSDDSSVRAEAKWLGNLGPVDAVSTTFQNSERFLREIQNLSENHKSIVVIEGDLRSFEHWESSGGCAFKTAFKRWLTWTIDYGLSFILSNDAVDTLGRFLLRSRSARKKYRPQSAWSMVEAIDKKSLNSAMTMAFNKSFGLSADQEIDQRLVVVCHFDYRDLSEFERREVVRNLVTSGTVPVFLGHLTDADIKSELIDHLKKKIESRARAMVSGHDFRLWPANILAKEGKMKKASTWKPLETKRQRGKAHVLYWGPEQEDGFVLVRYNKDGVASIYEPLAGCGVVDLLDDPKGIDDSDKWSFVCHKANGDSEDDREIDLVEEYVYPTLANLFKDRRERGFRYFGGGILQKPAQADPAQEKSEEPPATSDKPDADKPEIVEVSVDPEHTRVDVPTIDLSQIDRRIIGDRINYSLQMRNPDRIAVQEQEDWNEVNDVRWSDVAKPMKIGEQGVFVLLIGPPKVGKTTALASVVKEYGPESVGLLTAGETDGWKVVRKETGIDPVGVDIEALSGFADLNGVLDSINPNDLKVLLVDSLDGAGRWAEDILCSNNKKRIVEGIPKLDIRGYGLRLAWMQDFVKRLYAISRSGVHVIVTVGAKRDDNGFTWPDLEGQAASRMPRFFSDVGQIVVGYKNGNPHRQISWGVDMSCAGTRTGFPTISNRKLGSLLRRFEGKFAEPEATNHDDEIEKVAAQAGVSDAVTSDPEPSKKEVPAESKAAIPPPTTGFKKDVLDALVGGSMPLTVADEIAAKYGSTWNDWDAEIPTEEKDRVINFLDWLSLVLMQGLPSGQDVKIAFAFWGKLHDSSFLNDLKKDLFSRAKDGDTTKRKFWTDLYKSHS